MKGLKMKSYSLETMKEINDALVMLRNFIAKCGPYEQGEWKVDMPNAIECKRILSKFGIGLGEMLRLWGYEADVKVCEGIGFFPKQPWVGVMFSGEKATDGVYPVVGFTEDGRKIFVGCVTSKVTRHEKFIERFCARENMTDEAEQALRSVDKFGDEALADRIHVFEVNGALAESELYHAFRDAMEYYIAYRRVAIIPSCSLMWHERHTCFDWMLFLKTIKAKDATSYKIKCNERGNVDSCEIKKKCSIDSTLVVLSVILFLLFATVICSAYICSSNVSETIRMEMEIRK